MRKTPNSPDIGDNFIVCELCNNKYQTLTAHLRKHGVSVWEYKQEFGYCISQALECYDLQKVRRDYANKYRTFDKNFENKSDYSFAKTGVPPKRRSLQEKELNTLNIRGKNVWEIGSESQKKKLREKLSETAKREGWVLRIKKMRESL